MMDFWKAVYDALDREDKKAFEAYRDQYVENGYQSFSREERMIRFAQTVAYYHKLRANEKAALHKRLDSGLRYRRAA